MHWNKALQQGIPFPTFWMSSFINFTPFDQIEVATGEYFQQRLPELSELDSFFAATGLEGAAFTGAGFAAGFKQLLDKSS